MEFIVPFGAKAADVTARDSELESNKCVDFDSEEEQELEYMANAFVAVKAGKLNGEIDERSPFWIGLIYRVWYEATLHGKGVPAALPFDLAGF